MVRGEAAIARASALKLYLSERIASEADTDIERGVVRPKPSKIPSNWISDFHSLVQPSFADIGSIFTATIPFVAEELRSISMRCWQTWHWKKATKGSLKPSN